MENRKNSEGEGKRRKHLQYSLQMVTLPKRFNYWMFVRDVNDLWFLLLLRLHYSAKTNLRPRQFSTVHFVNTFSKDFQQFYRYQLCYCSLVASCLHICVCWSHISHCNWHKIHIDTDRCYILIFPPYSFFSPEKWVYTQFSPRKNEYILRFPPQKNEYILNFPPGNPSMC